VCTEVGNREDQKEQGAPRSTLKADRQIVGMGITGIGIAVSIFRPATPFDGAAGKRPGSCGLISFSDRRKLLFLLAG
jgi:hypothetical protein